MKQIKLPLLVAAIFSICSCEIKELPETVDTPIMTFYNSQSVIIDSSKYQPISTGTFNVKLYYHMDLSKVYDPTLIDQCYYAINNSVSLYNAGAGGMVSFTYYSTNSLKVRMIMKLKNDVHCQFSEFHTVF